MSEFLYHEACDDCGSKDNRAVFSDGHKWCFGCETFTPASSDGQLAKLLAPKEQKEEKNNKNDSNPLPLDFSYSIPKLGIDWISEYGISDVEIARLKLGWSYNFYRANLIGKTDGVKFHYGHMSVGTLIFPFYPEPGVFAGWQGRTFPISENLRRQYSIPKYLTFTKPGFLPLYRNFSDTHSVCIVEDVLSAVKVSRQMSCMALLKASVGVGRLAELGRTWKRLVIWIDSDMTERAFEIERTARPFFDLVEIISTPMDPKVYSDDVIQKKVLDV